MVFELQLFVNLFFSFLDFCGFTLLSMGIYRIPLSLYWKRLLAMQFVFLAVYFIHDSLLHNKDFYSFNILLTAIVLSTFLLRIPLLYSFLIWGTGYLIYIVIQGIVVFLLRVTGLLSTEELMSVAMYRNIGMLLSFLLNAAIYYFIEYKRLGFMFIMNRFRLQKRNLQMKDIFIASLFVCTVSLAQLGYVSFTSNQMNQYLLGVLLLMISISLIGLYITYKLNMKEIDERFNSLRGNKR